MKTILASLFLALSALLPADPISGSWKVLGPGGGGAMYHPTISPHSDRDVLVACDMTGAYLSRDGGESWRLFNLHGVPRFFEFDPQDRNTFYAGTRALWRSTDGGASWQRVWPREIERIDMGNDHADEYYVAEGGRMRSILALAIDPADSAIIYAALEENGAVSLEESRDRGAVWRPIAPLPGGARRILVDAASPRDNRTLYVLGDNAVAVRRGGQWQSSSAPAEQIADMSAGFAADGRLTVYAVASSALYVSTDGGARWVRRGLAGPASYRAIATSLRHPDVAYVAYGGYEDKYFGVARTADSGATWQLVWKEMAQAPASNISDAWITERYGPEWGEQPLNLGVSPTNPDLCFGTDFGRAMRTRDGGKTWTAAYSRRVPGAGWVSTGLDVTTTHGVHFDPFDSRRIFLANTDTGLLRSEDGGRTWVSSSHGFPQDWINTTYWMAFDPEVKGRVWAVASGTHDLPRPKMWRRTPPANFQGGVVVSEDGGKTWSPSSAGMPTTAGVHIVLDPASPKGARTLYVAAFGRGVFKSTDGGRSWQPRNTGIEGAEPFAWRIVPDGAGALYLLVARRSEDGSIGNAQDGALYRSSDGAGSWTKVALPANVNAPNGLAVDPGDPRRLYLAAWRRKGPEADGGGGVYLSTDSGLSWRRVFDRDQHVFDLTIDPRNPAVIYACGFSSSAWRSADRGATWERLPGYDFKWGQRVFPDPADPAKVYIATFGGGVWHGPAADKRKISGRTPGRR